MIQWGAMVKNHLLPLLQPHWARWLAFIAWTALSLVMLLQSSQNPLIGPAANPDEPTTLAWEIVLFLAHAFTFATLTALHWWALEPHLPKNRALLIAVIFAIGLGILTESLQGLVPDRNTSLFDIITNSSAALLVGWVVNRWYRA